MKRILRVLVLLCLIAIPSLVRAAVTVSFTTASGNTTGCNILNVTFVPTVTGCTGTPAYTWYYIHQPAATAADTSSSTSATHAFTAVGSYNVVLRVVCGAETAYAVQPNYINITPPPTINFTAANGNADTLRCAGVINFNNTSTGDTLCAGHTWTWVVLGPGSNPNQNTTNASFNFTTPGYYTVTLIYANAPGTCNCFGNMSKSQYIHVIDPPTACITRTDVASDCVAPVNTSFSAACSTNGNSYVWSYTGGPSTTTSANTFTHTFGTTGNYTVGVTVNNTAAVGCTATAAPISLHVGNFTANFLPTPDTVCENQSFTLTDNTTADVIAPVTQAFYIYDVTFGEPGTVVGGPYTSPATTSISILPGAAGRYRIEDNLINGNGCTSAASHYIYVRPKPTTTITTTQPYACAPPLVATLSASPVVAANTYTWTTPGATPATFSGTGATGASHAFTYSTLGTNNVTLVVRDIHGCKDSAFYAGYERVAKPTFLITKQVDSGCTPINVCYHIETSDPVGLPFTIDGVTFGDGGTAAGGSYADVCHLYSAGGSFLTTFNWRLDPSVGGCTGSDTVRVLIGANHPSMTINAYPVNDAGLHPILGDSICPNRSIFFNDPLCPTCTKSWSVVTVTGFPAASFVGDTAFGTYPTPSASGGPTAWTTTHVSCLAGCCDTLRKRIWVFPPPIATNSLQASYFGHCNRRDSIDFTVTGATGAYAYHWEYGDGDTAFTSGPGANVSHHTYHPASPTVGVYYTARVTAVALGLTTIGSDTTGRYCRNADDITIYVGPPNKTWNIYDTVICKGSTVNYRGPRQADGSAYTSYIWSFGDGATATTNFDSVTTHTYNSVGNYTNRVIFRNNSNCPDTAEIKHVHVYGPSGGFTLNPNPICAGDLVTINDFNSLAGAGLFKRMVSYDYPTAPLTAVSTSGSSFTHVFPEATSPDGTFLVVLSDTDNTVKHCASFDSVRVRSTHPHAYFTSPDTTGACLNKSITFNDTNTHCTYAWDFGDGFTTAPSATAKNITHTYAANGDYTVTVTIVADGTGIYPAGCTSTFTRTNYIHLTNASGIGIANYGDMSAGCPPLFLSVGPDPSSPNAATYTINWYVTGTGSGVGPYSGAYVNALLDGVGNHDAIMIATSPRGCVDSQSMSYFIGGPSGSVTATPTSGCAPASITLHFTNTGATPVGSSYNWTACPFGDFTSTTPDTTLIYTTPGTYCAPSVVITSPGCAVTVNSTALITIDSPVVVAVTHSPRICYGGTDILTASGAATYAWYGPSGSLCPSSCTFISVSPLVNTIYTVVGTNAAGCTDSEFVTVVVDSPIIVAVSGPDSMCIGQSVQLTATGGSGVFRWVSHPGLTDTSGISCSVCNPVTITSTITRTYWAITTNASGCTDSASHTVVVNPLPILTVTPNPAFVCDGSSTQLNVSGASTYLWTPRIGLSCDSCSNPISTITSNIIYSVTGTTSFGCRDSITVPVEVFHRNVTSVRGDTIICFGDNARLIARGGVSYRWSPGNTVSDSTIYNPIATPTVTTIYTVYIHENPCFDTIMYVKVTVIPTPVIRVPTTVTIIAGNSVQLYGDALNPVTLTTYAWTPADSTLSCTDCPHPIATPVVTTTYTVVASTIEGCTGTNTVTIKLLCNTDQVFIPNTFTPNGDGNNDRFFVSGKGLGVIKRMAVYNRWGELVYEAYGIHPNDAAMGWDGTYRGEIVAPDVFVYVLEVECSTGEPFVFRGDISLVR